MIQVYDIKTLQPVNAGGYNPLSSDVLLFNILIELRVLTGLIHSQQFGSVTESIGVMRNDIINETVNPSV